MVLHNGQTEIERVEIDVENAFENEEKMFANVIERKSSTRTEKIITDDDFIAMTIVRRNRTFEAIERWKLMAEQVDMPLQHLTEGAIEDDLSVLRKNFHHRKLLIGTFG